MKKLLLSSVLATGFAFNASCVENDNIVNDNNISNSNDNQEILQKATPGRSSILARSFVGVLSAGVGGLLFYKISNESKLTAFVGGFLSGLAGYYIKSLNEEINGHKLLLERSYKSLNEEINSYKSLLEYGCGMDYLFKDEGRYLFNNKPDLLNTILQEHVSYSKVLGQNDFSYSPQNVDHQQGDQENHNGENDDNA